MRIIGTAASAVMLAAGLCTIPASLPAAALSGSFNINGSVTVTATTITWTSTAGAAGMTTIAANGLTGSFVGLGNTDVPITNLDQTVEPVDTMFTPITFISLAGVGLPDLMIDFIPPGGFPGTDCTAAPAPSQVCTPTGITPGGTASPFQFTNGTGPNFGSTGAISFDGVTSDGLSSWNGILTAQFGVPFQDVLAAFLPGGSGSVQNTYSATLTVTATPAVPEPSTLVFALGTLLILFGVRRKANSRR
jgi:hypothetical protein